MHPMLSVVIPTFDTGGMTLRCCASVMAALPDGGEVIVSDDGSQDATSARISERFPSVRIVRSETNGGFAKAANRGVEAARGDLLLLLNSDTLVPAGALDAIVSAFERTPTLGVAAPRLVDQTGEPQWSSGRTPTLFWLIVMVSGAASFTSGFRGKGKEQEGDVDWVTGAAMAIRRAAWDAAGPLREDFRFYAQDLDFCVRARKCGWRVQLLDGIPITHLHGATVAAGSALPYSPELLWSDLLTWGRGEYGEAWARRARRAMSLAARARLSVRRGMEMVPGTESRRAVTMLYQRGYEALRNSRS